MSAVILSRPDPRDAMRQALAIISAAGRQYRRAVILRCADAMGPERALTMADRNRKPGQSRLAALKDRARAERQAIRRCGYDKPIEISPLREALAAMVWVFRVEARDRQFWKNRYQERVA